MKDIKPKILILDNSPDITGAFRSILAIAKYLNKEFEFYFATSSKHLITTIRKNGTKVKYIPFLEIQRNWKLILYFPFLLINTIRLQKIISNNQIGVIHVNDIYNMCGILLKFFNPGLKVVYHVRLLPDSYARMLYRSWIKLIWKFSNHIICVSKTVYHSCAKSEKKIIIYDALPSVIQHKKIQKTKLFTYLYVGNFIPGKGQNFAIEAFAKVKKKINDVQLIFIGGDLGKKKNKKYKFELENRVKSLALDKNVIFLTLQKDLSKYYRSAQVVINFSESESFSMVCLEALMAGTSVIATRCGGPEEIIDHGENGFLVNNRDIEDMSGAMVTIFDQNELRRKMEVNTMEIEDKFSLSVAAHKLSLIYKASC